MICPVCRIELIGVERSRVELDYCISCRGLWFDRGELDLLAELTGADLRPLSDDARPEQATRRHCPRCRKNLQEVAIGSIRIDRCPRGEGLWLDRGELGSLIDRGRPAESPLNAISSFLGEVFSGPSDHPSREKEFS